MRKYIAGLFATATLGGGAVFGADRAQNPYDDKGTHYELPIKADIPQDERVEIAKDKAAMTLKGWNDEYAITITTQIPTATFGADKPIERPFNVEAHRKLFSKKVEYRSGDVTAFIEPKEGTENEFDIDFTLHSKPDTNVFEYKIEGADEFDFFYQPELTPEEIAEGAERPDNVIGSYAVYHKTKANHRIGSTNYATGKAFHIYRPKAIDANGEEVWAELSYDNGVLSVTVPDKWLETATYPVLVDPTFGYFTIGGTKLTVPAGGIVAVAAVAGSYTATAGDTLTSISFYASSTASTNLAVAAYVLSAGTPTSQLGSASTTLTVSTTPNWYNSATVSQSMSAGSVYAPAFSYPNPSSLVIDVYFDAGVAPGRLTCTTTTVPFGYLLNPFCAVGTDSGRHFSIYATYTASGGGGDAVGNTYFEVLD